MIDNREESTHDAVYEYKFAQISKSIDNQSMQIEKLKDGIHELELTTSTSIVELKTRLVTYVTLISAGASIIVGYIMSHVT